jgi:uncharacterized protein YbjT (DUF2867 family)
VPPLPEETAVVTGAFSFTGRAIAERLLAAGVRVKTLTGHPNRPNPFAGRIETAPYRFDDPSALARSLEGASSLFNTYWVRFPRKGVGFDEAIDNSRRLIAAAGQAGVRRIVHVSITNPSLDSPLPYFRGKAMVEQAIRQSGLSHAILRTTVIFGSGGLLINNIAWFLRRFPLFAVPGDGRYRVQPVSVDDVADAAVSACARQENITRDVVGPETFTFDDLVRLIAAALGRRARLVHLPPPVVLAMLKPAGAMLGDVVLTRDEIDGLMANLLISAEPPSGRVPLSDWLQANAATVGTRYISELALHFR